MMTAETLNLNSFEKNLGEAKTLALYDESSPRVAFMRSSSDARRRLQETEDTIEAYFTRILSPLVLEPGVAVTDGPSEIVPPNSDVFRQLAVFAPLLRAKSVVAHYRGTLTVRGKRTAWIVSQRNRDGRKLEFTKLFLALFKRSHTFNETFLQRFQDAPQNADAVGSNVPHIIEVVVGLDEQNRIESSDGRMRIGVSRELANILTADDSLVKMMNDALPDVPQLGVEAVATKLRESCFVETRDTAVTVAKNVLIRGDLTDASFACDLVTLLGGPRVEPGQVASLHGSTVIRRGLAALQACCMFRDVLGHTMWFFPVAPPAEHPDLPWCSLSVYPEEELKNDTIVRFSNDETRQAWQHTAVQAVGSLVSEIMSLVDQLRPTDTSGLMDILGEAEASEVVQRISKSRGLLTHDVMAAVLGTASGLRGFNHEGSLVELSVIVGTKFHATEFLGSAFELGDQLFELEKRSIRKLIATLKGNFALFEGERRAAFLEYHDRGLNLCRVVELLDDLTRTTEITGSRTAHLQALTSQSPDLVAFTITAERHATARVFYGGELLLLQNEQGWQTFEPKFEEAWAKVEEFATGGGGRASSAVLGTVRRLLQRLAVTEGVGATVVFGHHIEVDPFSAAMTASLPNVDGNQLLEPSREDFLFRLARMDGAMVIDLATAEVHPRRHITAIHQGLPAIPENLFFHGTEQRLSERWDHEHHALWYEWGTRHQTALLLSGLMPDIMVFVKSSSGSIALFRHGLNLLATPDGH